MTIKQHDMTRREYANFSLIIRQMLDYAVDLGFVERNLFREIRIPPKMFRKVKKKRSETQVYSYDEQAKLEQVAFEDFKTNTRRQTYPLVPLAIVFMFQTGVRVGELCALKYADMTEDGEIHVQRMLLRDLNKVVEHTKSDDGDRFIVLNHKASLAIEQAKRHQEQAGESAPEYIFSTGGRLLSPHAVNDTLRTFCKRAGIPYRSSHKIRKTVISSLIDGGVNIDTVREFAGHSEEKTTLKHYCYDRSEKSERKQRILKALG